MTVADPGKHIDPIASDPMLSPVLVVGSGGSGTTWLQTLLSQHPAVASAPETEVFTSYLSLLERQWEFKQAWRERYGVRTGLQGLISTDEFHAVLRPFSDKVFSAVLEAKPGATVVLEKTPNNLFHLPLILALYPRARFIHLIRDPRAVVASTQAAARGWGSHWAVSGWQAGAMRWRDIVSAGLAIRHTTDNLYELRYEDLKDNGSGQLQRLFDWLQLAVDEETCQGYVEACQIDRLRNQAMSESLSPVTNTREFFRQGSAAGWRNELSELHVAQIERVAGGLMTELGYEMTSSSGFRHRYVIRPLAACLAKLRAVVTFLSRGLNWALKRIGQNL